jgi:signal transduction histidine kinase
LLLIVSKLRVLLHPIVIFVIAQISWALLMIVWITWYLRRSSEFELLIGKLGLSQSVEGGQIFILIQGCVLMGILLVALYAVFVNFRRQVRLNRLQDAILSNVTHELKTPIASMRMFVETMVMRDLSDAERKRFLARCLSEIERLQSLVDRILLSAQLSAAAKMGQHRPIDILQVALTSWQRLRERAGDTRKCKLEGFEESSWSNNTITVNGNEYELGILFDNLFDNALKYSHHGGAINFKVNWSKDKVEFRVSDDGTGIEPAQINRIFHKFYRAEATNKRNVKGSGLGLSVAQAIVKAHNGSISVTSGGLEKGATFHVIFKRSPTHH